MADLGDLGRFVPYATLRRSSATYALGGAVRAAALQQSRIACSWNWYASTAHLPGSGNSFTIPTVRRVTLTLSGRYIESTQGATGAVFYDVQDGTFYAHEADGTGLWLVTIANAVPTVQQISPDYGLGVGQRPVVLANGKPQLLAAGDFVLGVAMNFPMLLNSGATANLKLPSSNTLPLKLNNGSTTTLQVTLNG